MEYLYLFIGGLLVGAIGVVFGGSAFLAIPLMQTLFPGFSFGDVLGNVRVGSLGRSLASTGDDDDDDDSDDTSSTGGDDEDVALASDEDGGLADAADVDIDCTSPFLDTEGHWAEKTICLLYEIGTVSGYMDEDGEPTWMFGPDDTVTRAELLKMILLNAGETVEAVELDEDYTDVSEDDWYYSYVTYGTSIGVVEGYEDGAFRPNDSVNRAEAVVMLLRVAGVTEYDVEDIDFEDVEEAAWYEYAVAGAVDLGIVEGYEEDNTFRPANDITRGEAAAIIRRAWYVWY